MPATVTHALSMTKADNPAYQNRPSHWNQTHAVTLDVQATEVSGAFSNANGISFGLSDTRITASHNALTSQSNQAASAANGSFTFQTLSFSNANGLSFGTSAGPALTGSYTVPSTAGLISNINVSAGTTSNNLSALTFSNANGVTFGLDGSTLTASVAVGGGGLTNIRLSAGTTSNLLSAVTFANSNGVSFGIDASTVTASVATSLTNIRVSAGTTSNLLSAITFSNANGISFGIDASTITASHNALTSQSTQYLAITLGGNTAGTTSFHATDNATIFLHGGNNITLSGNGSTITISAGAGGGGGVTLSRFEVKPFEATGFSLLSHGPASWHFNPFYLTAPLTFSNIWVLKSVVASTSISSNSSGRQSYSYRHGVTLWKRVDWSNSSTQLTTVTTASFGMSFSRSHTGSSNSVSAAWVTNTTGGTSSFSTTSNASNWANFFSGIRLFAIPCVTSLSAGEYFIAHQHSSTTATSGSNATVWFFSNVIQQLQSASSSFFPRFGVSTGQSLSAMPAGIGFGFASAVTTTTTYAASVITADAGANQFKYLYANFVNLGVS